MQQQSIRNFFNRSRATTIAFIVFAALLVISLIGLLVSGLQRGSQAEEITLENEQEGKYGYIEVELLTDWFAAYEDDTLFWHIARTPDGALYVVAMTRSDFENNFQAQFEYAYNDSEIPPAPVRATGELKAMDDELIQMGAETMEWDVDTFCSQCGVLYLDTTVTQYGSGEGGSLALVGVIFSGLFTLIYGIIFFSRKSKIRKTIQRLSAANELELAASELSGPPAAAFDGGKVVFTDHFLASAESGVIVSYRDVLWAYVTVQRTNFIATGQHLTVRTANKLALDIARDRPGKRATGLTRAAIEELARRCPGLLIGFTRENNAEYNRRVKAIASGQAPYSPQQTAAQTDAQVPAEDYYKDSDPTIR